LGGVIENDATGERIELIRKNGVFVMRLETAEGKSGRKDEAAMEVDGVDEEKGVVFRRRMMR
jgi:hypothetical protein